MPPGSSTYAIHIIMDRATGKTMNCLVELETPADAADLVTRFTATCPRRKIGDRIARLSVSSQEVLMGTLFPKAVCVVWEGATPVVMPASEEFPEGFRGFCLPEHLVATRRWAETPHKVCAAPLPPLYTH